MSRILIHEPREHHEDWSGLLAGPGRDVVVCPGRESLLAALGERRPDVLVYVLDDLGNDLELLFALRRVASTLPIILLEGPTELAARRSIQELKPTYYGIEPLESTELSDVVRGALGRTVPRGAGS